MTDRSEILQHCRRFIAPTEQSALQEHDDLFASGLMDSMRVMELLSFLEERFTIVIPPEEITMKNFSSLSAIAQLVTTRERQA